MTTTYDPHHPAYYDEADLREELTRVYDLCHGCRLCFNLCPAFPSLFELVDAHDGDAAAMTPAEQDRVVDECYQCKLCYVKCPYVPPHEWELDFPRLMLRADAVRHRNGERPRSEQVTDQFLGRTDLLGRLGSATAPVANRLTGSPGSLPRRVMERTVGVAAQRLLPPYARERFSTWFRRRGGTTPAEAQGEVAVFPTCLVEYQHPDIGQDLVKVYERNRVACDVPAGTVCCGMPWLDGGDVDRFVAQAERNVAVLADQVRQGREVVVPQPTCGYVLRNEYPQYLENEDAQLVADHTKDACEYLMALRRGEDTALDEQFDGYVPETVSYHVPCHMQAQSIGLKSRDLIKLTGAQVTLARHCSGIDGLWGYRATAYELSRKVAEPLREALTEAGSEVVMGDCALANTAITEETGRVPVHPIQLVARAYGIPEED